MLGWDENLKCGLGPWMSLCTTMISLDLIRRTGWSCESERKVISEDAYSLLKLYLNLESAVVINNCYYHYIARTRLLSLSWREDRFQRIKENHSSMMNIVQEAGIAEECKQAICSQYLDYLIAYYKSVLSTKKGTGDQYELIKYTLFDNENQRIMRGLNNRTLGLKKRIMRRPL